MQDALHPRGNEHDDDGGEEVLPIDGYFLARTWIQN